MLFVISLSLFHFLFQAPYNYIGESDNTDPDPRGLVSRSLQLRFRVERKLSHKATVELRCVSSLPGVPLPPQEAKTTFIFQSLQPQINQQLQYHRISSGVAAKPEGSLTMVLVVLLAVVRWLGVRNER